MNQLFLKPGGRLEYVRSVFNEDTEKADDVAIDVTESAASYLLEPIIFEGEIHVRDVFLLLGASPALLEVFARQHAIAYLDEARKGNARPYTGQYDPNGTEYLELFYDWQVACECGQLDGTHRLWLRGVGYELQEDIEESSGFKYKRGARIHWSVMFSPVADLLNLPLRVNPEVSVTQSDGGYERMNQALYRFNVTRPTLAQVIQGLLWELSFGGDPEQTDEIVQDLLDARKEMDPLAGQDET
ncbi:hypothetical protein FAZ95_01050 [Trinickia violacea]|uniref:Uncharacterized protein n=1 Tax=Trinickia violacea TaxID=2571746 RepID=A0A4P8IJC3_9BURK|nr:hypothetical protein [Trinickia violacea]QCP47891.1 hypothetical protein FAZ95_01050 [Trinickia violacea]